MSTWFINSSSRCVSAEGVDWLDALAAALPHFKLAPGVLGDLTCSFRTDGSVDVLEPRSNLGLHVAAQDAVDALFDRCGRISTANNVGDASSIALDLARELVGAESGAVAVTTRTGAELEFVAAFGPGSARRLGTRTPADHGIAGFITNFQTGTVVHDVRHDTRFSDVNREDVSADVYAMLGVPILVRNGPCYGCLELTNLPAGFHPRELQVTQAVASALAAWFLGAGV